MLAIRTVKSASHTYKLPINYPIKNLFSPTKILHQPGLLSQNAAIYNRYLQPLSKISSAQPMVRRPLGHALSYSHALRQLKEPASTIQMASKFTTSNGSAVDDNQNSITAGSLGPIVLSDTHLLNKLASFDRERIPERVVHAKGAGAHGYFEVTHDLTRFTKACVFSSVGKKTPIFARFSTVAGEKGSSDTERDPRGFALKFYTEEGNWDMTGNNTPVFFIRDPLKFPDFIHTQKRDPRTNLKNPSAVWDFFGLTPESTHQVTILMSDRGTPDGFRHMHGFSSHTFRWVNKSGEAVWVKLHFRTLSGIKNLTSEQAKGLLEDHDYATRDLFSHLQQGKTAEWELSVQVIPERDGFSYNWNIFDVTKVVPHGDYPLLPLGKLVLNRNVANFFAETEQAAFSPGNLVPGIEPSLDKMLQGRLFSYPDTHRHRLGPNFTQIPINCPYRARVYNTHRDGPMRVDDNGGDAANYEPNTRNNGENSFTFDSDSRLSAYKVTGLVARHKPNHPNSDFAQPGTLFRKVMDEQMRQHTASNIVGTMKGVERQIQERAVKNFYKADPEYGEAIAKQLGFPSLKSRL